jgi:hypothetical protein
MTLINVYNCDTHYGAHRFDENSNWSIPLYMLPDSIGRSEAEYACNYAYGK